MPDDETGTREHLMGVAKFATMTRPARHRPILPNKTSLIYVNAPLRQLFLFLATYLKPILDILVLESQQGPMLLTVQDVGWVELS